MKKLIIFSILSFTVSFNLQAQEETTTKSLSASLGLYVFPANDQSKEVQEADEKTCYEWAMQQTGVDPANPVEVEVAQANTNPDGTAVRGAARGAAAGAAIGAISGDAGQGAAVGAVVGGLAGRRAKKVGDHVEQAENNAEASAKEKEMIDNFKKAYTACLEGKGYTVN